MTIYFFHLVSAEDNFRQLTAGRRENLPTCAPAPSTSRQTTTL